MTRSAKLRDSPYHRSTRTRGPRSVFTEKRRGIGVVRKNSETQRRERREKRTLLVGGNGELKRTSLSLKKV